MCSQLDNLSTLGNLNLPLRIQRKGNFLSDDGFLDFRRHFESAASDLLQEFDMGRNEDVFRSYRRLRDHQLSGTDRTAKIAEEADKFKIVMDVEGFCDGDLKVNVSGPNEIVVEGKQEVGGSNGGSGGGSGGSYRNIRSFRRRFSLPGLALVQDASSVVSSDNVLTINIPKKIQEITESSTSSVEQQILQQQQQLKEQQQLLQQQQEQLKQEQLKQEQLKQQKIQQQQQEILKQQQQQEIIKQQQQQQQQTQKIESEMKESIQRFTQDSSFPFKTDISSPFSSDNIWDLQIVPRKSFFDDSFFENVRHNFQKSVEQMMEEKRRHVTSTADSGIVRKVRGTSEGNVQAISVTDDTNEYKIVLDVHGFSEGDLKVRAVSECALIVEGKVEKKTEYTSCSHNFNKKFSLPSSVIIRQATSALSSEGILTIIIPKRLESIDYAIPVKTEAATQLTNLIKKDQEKETSSTTSVINQREKIVPLVQEDNFLNSQQQTIQQQSTVSGTNKSSNATATNITDSQNLLSNLEKKIETEKKICESLDAREHFVPINLEGGQTVNTSEKTQNTTYRVTEPSQVVKESKKLVSESTKLMQEMASTERRAPSEHYVPVELDAGITVSPNTNTQFKSTDTPSTNLSKNISSTTDTSKTSVHQQTSNIQQRPSSARIIPISLKGSFYNESIFDDTRKSIDKEVKQVFTKYRQTSVIDEKKESSELQASTQDTSSLLKNTQTTSTILDDAHNYKIVLDVFGFEEKELSIEVSGLNEISIEGNSEKTKGGSLSKHSFQRSFQLPNNVDLDRTSTALSEEGILTVTVPKKNQLLLVDKPASSSANSRIEKTLKKSNEVQTTMVIDSSGVVQENKSQKSSITDNAGNVSQSTSSTTSTQHITSVPSSSQTSQNTQQTSLTSGGQREYIVPLSIEDVSDVTSEAGSVQSTSNLTSQMSTTSNTSRDVSQDILSDTASTTSMDSQIQSRSNLMDTNNTIQLQGLTTAANTNQSTMSRFNDQTRDIMTKTLFNLPIVTKGHFFDDSFFQDSRPMFESLLRNKMNRFNRSTSFVDDLGFFKSLRDNKITSGNQMATLSEDDHFNKIVLDVHGFTENNLKIRALSENEILIEGEEEERTGNSVSKKVFRKHFVLPGSVNLKGASSALSSDGVLNIIIPKC